MLRCQAEIATTNGYWSRCNATPAHVHHMLTRARGGLLLDAVGETYHHIPLCARCHTIAHDVPGTGLIIDGLVTTDLAGNPVYTGSDQYLKDKYGSG